MTKRFLSSILVLGAAACWLAGCSSPKKPAAGQAAPPSDIASAHGQSDAGGGAPGGMPPGDVVPPPPGDSPTAAAGLAWDLPAGWAVAAQRSMRVATYQVPAAAGDEEGAECAVHHFGAGQGGSVDANLQRWVGQFQPATKSSRSARKVNGLPVSLVDVSGTYTAHGGGMSGPSEPVPGWRLLGAIVEGPEGAVFFKLAGPEKTVAAASRAFDALVGSVRKK